MRDFVFLHDNFLLNIINKLTVTCFIGSSARDLKPDKTLLLDRLIVKREGHSRKHIFFVNANNNRSYISGCYNGKFLSTAGS